METRNDTLSSERAPKILDIDIRTTDFILILFTEIALMKIG